MRGEGAPVLTSTSLQISNFHLPSPTRSSLKPAKNFQNATRFWAMGRGKFPSPQPSSDLSCRRRHLSEMSFPSVLFRSETLETLARVSADQTTAESSTSAAPPLIDSTAAGVVRRFYDGVNRRDLASVEFLIAEGCIYEDLIFSQPFVGRKAILEFFTKFTESMSSDLQFVIDEISNEDTSAVGVTWHLEWQGRPFPFSKGCSFYRLEVQNGKKQIVYGRDCVEPATKPGEMALVLIRGVTWMLQQFPQLADRI